jgi:hypothetical protein
LNQEISGENTAISNPFQEELEGRWMQTLLFWLKLRSEQHSKKKMAGTSSTKNELSNDVDDATGGF